MKQRVDDLALFGGPAEFLQPLYVGRPSIGDRSRFLERLNWAADLSPKGLQQSAGIMINYLYRLSEIEANHETYTDEGRIAASQQLRALLR